MAIGRVKAPIGIGGRFAGYELEEVAAEGGIGVVYRARDLRLGREVALRIIEPDVARDPVTRARVNRAATVLASLDHPNVVPIYEATESDGRLFTVTRWVTGTNLGALVREHGPLEARRAVRIVNQVASALQAAHAAGIMHRSVKPSSVLVTDSDHAYLTDFALARRSSDLTGLTMHERLAESFDYVAPEYIEGDSVDSRVDLYGLGCVLYEALTGEVPYPAATPAAKIYAHRSADPPSARARAPEVPEALDEVVKRAMAKNPADRYQSPADFAAAAAGTVGMPAPLWAEKSPAHPAESSAAAHGQAPEPVDGRARAASAVQEEWSEPAYFSARRVSPARRLAVAAAVLLFLAAPIALVLAIALHG